MSIPKQEICGASSNPTFDAFHKFQEGFNQEFETRDNIRLAVKDLEDKTRSVLNILQSVHHQDGLKNVEQICDVCSLKLQELQSPLKTLSSKFPPICYYKYNDQWRSTIQRLTFLACFIKFLKSNEFLTHEDCASVLGIGTNNDDGFHLELDDYLFGLLTLASELARLSVNAVTGGCYDWPIRIARFVGELDSGFRLLNLKNDWLRKRYDVLKYDLKKIEEVVYDLSIRSLKPNDELS